MTIRPHVIQIELLTTIRAVRGIESCYNAGSALVNFADSELPDLDPSKTQRKEAAVSRESLTSRVHFVSEKWGP
jgi:hypothetical protein